MVCQQQRVDSGACQRWLATAISLWLLVTLVDAPCSDAQSSAQLAIVTADQSRDATAEAAPAADPVDPPAQATEQYRNQI